MGIATKITLAPRTLRVMVDDEISEEDTPIVHHTVLERFREVTGYRPVALRNVEYKVMQERRETRSEPPPRHRGYEGRGSEKITLSGGGCVIMAKKET